MRAPVLVTLLMAVSGLSSAEDFPIPAATQLEVVADELIQNGVPMSIQRFQTDMTPEAVREFYRAHWSAPVAPAAPGHVETAVGDWHVISRLTEHEHLLVRMRPAHNGGTTGFLARINRDSDTQVHPLTELLPASLTDELLSITESRADEGAAVTAIYRIRGPAGDALALVQRHLVEQGLQVRQAFEHEAVKVQFLTGPRVHAELAVQRDGGGDVLVINLVER